MPAHRSSEKVLQRTLDVYTEQGTFVAASKLLNLPRSTLESRITEARRRGMVAKTTLKKREAEPVDEVGLLKDRNRTLEALLKTRRDDELNEERIRTSVLKLTSVSALPPSWVSKVPERSHTVPGIPTLQLSDFHWGEIVDPTQIGGVNSYNLEIAQRRLRTCVDTAIDLLTNHMVNPKYPGIVVPLGGDMVTGDIHEELSATNEREIMPTFVDLFGCLVWAIERLADTFGHVFLPCVTGNHGRNTFKIRAKGRAFTNFDWLLYVMLEKHFQRDKRVTFYIPNGSDALYRVYGYRYLLSHGDQFRGGDSIIGCLGPLTRGDNKKRSRNSQIGQDYDTMVVGHWHQRIMLNKLIVNSSLKGYDEYASQNNFPYEPPSQNLWMTHPIYGITFAMPVFCDRIKEKTSGLSWISIPER